MLEISEYINFGSFYQSHVKLFLKDVNNLKTTSGCKDAFINDSGHVLSKVEIFGFVTSAQERTSCFTYSVEDGTGSIKCVLWKNEINLPPNFTSIANLCASTNGNLLSQKLSNIINSQKCAIKLGEFVNIQGRLTINKYDNCTEIYISNLSHITNNSLDQWLMWTKKALELKTNFYSKPFITQLTQDELSQSYDIALENMIKTKLEDMLFSNHSSVQKFNGYDILEQIMTSKKALMREISRYTITQSSQPVPDEKKVEIMIVKCIKTILNYYTNIGKLIREKCDANCKITSVPELDALYIVKK